MTANLFRDLHNNAEYNSSERPVCIRKTRRSFELLFLPASDSDFLPGRNKRHVSPLRHRPMGELHPSIRDILLHNVETEPPSRGSEYQPRQQFCTSG